MTKYLFILGRNPKLSIAELKGYCNRVGNVINNIQQRENAVLVDLEKTVDAGAVDFLGGTIAIGVVLCQNKDIDKTEIYYSEKNNFSYGIWDFADEEIVEGISGYLKVRFKREKLKASEKKIVNFDLQGSSDAGKRFRSKLIDEEYFVFENYFGKIVQKCDYKEIEKRDMEKPVRRESLSISPRLAKIMINLSEIEEDGILLDAFCGVGVVLIEALSSGIANKVVGVDKDERAIQGAKENLKYFDFPEKKYKLINFDSSKIDFSKEKIEVMVSEPDFGDTLKKIPTPDKAKEMIKRYEKIMVGVLRNVKNFVSGRIVFTSPYIRTVGKKRIGVDFESFSERVGLKMIGGFPIDEFRENQIVGRQVVVFSK